MGAVSTPFKARSRVTGMHKWICPFCGRANSNPMRLNTWKVECSNGACRRTLGYGGTFFIIPKGSGGRAPDDIVIPAQCEVESLPYINGVPSVVRVLDASDSLSLIPGLVINGDIDLDIS